VSRKIILAAGKTVLQMNGHSLCQEAHFLCRECISCVTLSDSGNYAAAAVHEAGGGTHVFHVQREEGSDNPEQQYLECPKVTGVGVVSRMAFSPNAAFLVCVSGEEAKTHVVVWRWRSATIVAERIAPHAITALCFLPRSNTTFAAGGRDLTFWTVKSMGKGLEIKFHSSKWDRHFVGLVPGANEGILGLTQGGRLCHVNPSSKKKCEKWLDTKIDRAMFIAVGAGLIAVGGSGGIVRVFQQTSWAFVCNLPKAPDDVSCINGHFLTGVMGGSP